MRMKWMQPALLLAGVAVLASVAAHAQTDVAASVVGAYNQTTKGNDVEQTPSNVAGAEVEVRHISKPWFGYEGAYSFHRANQRYNVIDQICPVTMKICPNTSSPTMVHAYAHEVTGAWVVSMKIKNLRPFALAGGGLLLDVPSVGQVSTDATTTKGGKTIGGIFSSKTSTVAKPVFVYGAGVDWGLLPHFGLRLQYRGNLSKAPNLTKLYPSTGAFTHTAEPMVGLYFRF
jgi:hypothetical protein